MNISEHITFFIQEMNRRNFSNNSSIEEYNIKINLLTNKLLSLKNLRRDKCAQNKSLILSENKFVELEKANKIGKILLLKQSEFLSVY